MPDESPRRNVKRFGDFELLEKIGQGGMSSVYKARDTRSEAIVAVKIASHLVVNDRQLSRRFELEYALAHPLDHPHLVKVLENGKEDKVPFLVMEYIDGPSLSQHLRNSERLSENDALALILPIGEALTYLHERQIIHRDIKPANILLTSSGMPKLADLGLVKNLESMSRLTKSNLGLGTMQFVSPEQFEDARKVDARSDIYSLAATLYLMLTGDYPFGKGAIMNVVSRKLKNEFDAPLVKAPQLRPCVDAAIRMGLQADRQNRPKSVQEFAALLTGEKKLQPTVTSAAPAPKTKTIKKADKERRGGNRFPVEVEAACRAMVNVAGKHWPAWITDVSVTGLCLHSQRRFEVGNILEVTFTLKADDSAITQVARVRWARPTETKSWLLGCEFVRAITEDEVNTICADGMDRTKMV